MRLCTPGLQGCSISHTPPWNPHHKSHGSGRIADIVAKTYFFMMYLGECVHTRVWCLQKPDEVVTSPDARVTSGRGR